MQYQGLEAQHKACSYGREGGGKVQLEVGKTPTPEKRWGDITERITEHRDWLPTKAVKSFWANFEDWNGEKPRIM